MIRKTIHCCKKLDKYLKIKQMPLQYYYIERQYGIHIKHSRSMYLAFYCPWCGEKLPKELTENYFEILEKEYGIDDPFHEERKNPNTFPEEFKSDEWWKKRGL